MTIAVFDTETTGLIEAMGTDLKFQPHIIEIYIAILNSSFKQVDEYQTLIKPPIPIPAYITKINGIDDAMVEKAPEFPEVFPKIAKTFLGCHTMVAANLTFDLGMLRLDLERCGKLFSFPYPPMPFCTMEQSMHLRGHRLKNKELYKIATGKDLVNAHRAKNDVMATIESFKWLKEFK